MTEPASSSKWAHPLRSNAPRSATLATGAPGPCITPSTETCVVVVSFMGFVLLVVDLVLGSSSGADPIASAFVSVDRAARPHLLVLGGRGHLRSLASGQPVTHKQLWGLRAGVRSWCARSG